MELNKAYFRFYEELNDFLPKKKRKTFFTYEFKGNPSIKDAVEALGVPHTEIDLILVNSQSVGFSHHIKDGDIISVYPVFETLDISKITNLREKPLREIKFVLDCHLGKLARYLRMLSFDTLYKNNYTDREVIKTSRTGSRTILTRDIGILKNKRVTHGYWIRSLDPKDQLMEVMDHFDLYSSIKPFHRCMECNGLIKKVRKEDILEQLPDRTKKYFNEIYQCTYCRQIYWKGSHYEKMNSLIEELRETNKIKKKSQ